MTNTSKYATKLLIHSKQVLTASTLCCVLLFTVDVAAAPTKKLSEKKHNARYAMFRDDIKTIILSPVVGPRFKDRDDIPDLIENLFTTSLINLGKQIVPSDTHAALWNEKMQDLGGIFDPITGEKNEEKSRQLLDYVRKGVKEAHDYDAILTPTLVVKELTHGGSSVTWDDTSQSIYFPGTKKLFRKGSAPERSVLRGISLNITLETPDGREIYSGKIGWELLEKYSKRGKEIVLPQDLFKDQEHNQSLIEDILKPLLKKYKYLYEYGIYKG